MGWCGGRELLEVDLFGHKYDGDACVIGEEGFERLG